MCFSSPKAPDVQAPPPPAVIPPPPTVMPSEVSAQTAQADRQKKLSQIRFGLASTIKTPQGITGTGAELAPAATTGKTTLG